MSSYIYSSKSPTDPEDDENEGDCKGDCEGVCPRFVIKKS